MSQLVRREIIDDGIAIITLNHPEKRNALSRELLATLLELLHQTSADENIKAVIINASGPVFSAGHDLRELVNGNRQDYDSLFAICTDVMETIRTMRQPVIAQVHGIATAAGCQLVASCDLVVASDNATFATPGVKIGLFCTTPAVALARAITPKKAMEMLLTGDSITAHEAERLGLVNRVTAADRLENETLALAKQIAASSAETIALGKQAFYAQLPLDYPQAYVCAQKEMVQNALMDDAQEGMKAFLEKRKPRWKSDRSLHHI
ncbi:MAG TPA: enoyl-CoA hydratase [Trichormus sp.]|jgi:enoyl-CoA hydratase/carnithine racemase